MDVRAVPFNFCLVRLCLLGQLPVGLLQLCERLLQLLVDPRPTLVHLAQRQILARQVLKAKKTPQKLMTIFNVILYDRCTLTDRQIIILESG